tara:strand:- start:5927 stop:6067 length:141 start_codon:yes stop_codon:yes gene_type:complete
MRIMTFQVKSDAASVTRNGLIRIPLSLTNLSSPGILCINNGMPRFE